MVWPDFMATEKIEHSYPVPIAFFFNLNDKFAWTISNSILIFIKRTLNWIVLKDFVWFLSSYVCYFRLATESDDSVAKSVGSIF